MLAEIGRGILQCIKIRMKSSTTTIKQKIHCKVIVHIQMYHIHISVTLKYIDAKYISTEPAAVRYEM